MMKSLSELNKFVFGILCNLKVLLFTPTILLDDRVNGLSGLIWVFLLETSLDFFSQWCKYEQQAHDAGSESAGDCKPDGLGRDQFSKDILEDDVGSEEEGDCYGNNQKDVCPPN